MSENQNPVSAGDHIMSLISNELFDMCHHLIDKDKDVAVAVEAIVAAYRINTIARSVIERVIAEEGQSPTLVKAMCSLAASRAKSTEFTRPQLLKSISDILEPMIRSEIMISSEEARTRTLEARALENKFRGRPAMVVGGIKEGVQTEVPLGRIMLILGEPTKLLKIAGNLLYDITKCNNESDSNAPNDYTRNVINLSGMADPKQITQKEPRIMRIPASKWQFLSRQRFELTLSAVAAQLQDRRVDLIIVDDAIKLAKSPLGDLGRSALKLDDGIRMMRHALGRLGAAAICMAPIPTDESDFVSHVRSMLEEHTEFMEI